MNYLMPDRDCVNTVAKAATDGDLQTFLQVSYFRQQISDVVGSQWREYWRSHGVKV